jgi:hypothetical protein
MRTADMIRIYSLALLFFTLVWISASPSATLGQVSGPPSPEIAVRISAPKREVKAGELFHVEVRVSNIGETAVLVPNTISTVSGGMAFLKFELTDSKGRVSPGMVWIADDFAPTTQSDENAAAKLLGFWTLLHPKTCLLFDVPIGQSKYDFLGKPGKYALSATYASNGISFGRNGLGLSKALLNSLPYKSWTGKVATNEISFNVVSATKIKK